MLQFVIKRLVCSFRRQSNVPLFVSFIEAQIGQLADLLLEAFLFFFLFLMEGRKEGNVLFNDALNTFYLRLYGVRHMVKDHSDSEKGNPLPPHRLLFPISSKGSFICTIPQTG